MLIPWLPSSAQAPSSPRKGVYEPWSFVPHAVSLRRALAHCGRFPTAASRRSLGRVSVPVWLTVLSNQLLIVAQVGRYPTSWLIRREPIPRRLGLLSLDSYPPCAEYGVLASVS